MRTQIEAGDRTRFQERVAELEDHADAAEVAQGAILHRLRINQRDAKRQRALWFVVIEHDHFHPAGAQERDLIERGRPAIDRDQELRLMLRAAALHAFAAKAVAFLHPQRQEERRRGAVSAEHGREQRERSDAIDIVVAEKNDALPAIDRLEDPRDRELHLRQEKGIA